MHILFKNLKKVAIISTLMWINIFSVVSLFVLTDVKAEPLSILKPKPPPDLTYDNFKSIGIPDSTYYIPLDNDRIDSSISNNCVKRGIPGNDLARYGNIQNGSQGFYNTGADIMQSAFFCKFWIENDGRCAASNFIDKFNNPAYKQDSDIVPTDLDIRKCIQYVKVGDRCLITPGAIDPKSNTVVNEKGVARTVYHGELNSSVYGAAADLFYCDLAGNSDIGSPGIGGTIQVIDIRCEKNPNFQKNGVQVCLRGRHVDEQKLAAGNNNGNTAFQDFSKTDSRLVSSDVSLSNPQGANIIQAVGVWDVITVILNILNGLGSFILTAVLTVLSIIALVIFNIIYLLSNYLANVINYIILINPSSDNFIGVSRAMTDVVKSIAYLMIIIAVAGTGVMYVFKGKNAVGQISEVIMTIAIVTIGINFSFYIVAAMIALSYQIGYIFSSGIVASAGEGYSVANIFTAYNESIISSYSANITISGAFTEAVNTLTGTQFTNFAVPLMMFIKYMILCIIMGFVVYIYITLLKTLAVRIAVLFLLLISSPIGFVLKFSNFKPFKSIGDKWFNTLVSYSISYPLIVILLAFAIVLNVKIGIQLDAAFITNELQTPAGSNWDLKAFTTSSINYFVPILIKVSITLGILMLVKQIIDEHLVPFANQVTNAASKAINGVNKFSKKAVAGAKTAGKVAAFGAGATFAGANAARRAIGNIRAANLQMRKNGGFLGLGRGADGNGWSRVRRNLRGVDANDPSVGRVSSDGSTSMLSAATRGFVRGKDMAVNNPVTRLYKATALRLKSGRALDQASELSRREMQMRMEADTPEKIAIADKFMQDNKLPTTFAGRGKVAMGTVTQAEKDFHMRRSGEQARNKILSPIGMDSMSNDQRLGLIASTRNTLLDRTAKSRYNVSRFDDLNDSQKTEVSSVVDASIARDGGGNTVVKSAIDELSKKMTMNEAMQIRDNKTLKALFSSRSFQDVFLEDGNTEGNEGFRRMYAGDTLVGLMDKDIRESTGASTFKKAVQKAVKKPEDIDRANLESLDFRAAVEKELMNSDPELAVKTYQKLNLNGAKLMERGAMATVQKGIDDALNRTANPITQTQALAANALATEVFSRGIFNPNDIKKMANDLASGIPVSEISSEKRALFTGLGNQANVADVKNIINNNPTLTDQDLANLLRQEMASRGILFSDNELTASSVQNIRNKLTTATNDNERLKVVSDELLGSGINLNTVVKQDNVKNGVRKMINEAISNGESLTIQANRVDREFNQDDAVQFLIDQIHNETNGISSDEARMRKIKASARKYFGDEGGDFIIKSAESNNGRINQSNLRGNAAALKEHVQMDGYDDYTKKMAEKIKLEGADVLDEFNKNALLSPFAKPALEALTHQVHASVSPTGTDMLSEGLKGSAGPDVSAAKTNELLRAISAQLSGGTPPTPPGASPQGPSTAGGNNSAGDTPIPGELVDNNDSNNVFDPSKFVRQVYTGPMPGNKSVSPNSNEKLPQINSAGNNIRNDITSQNSGKTNAAMANLDSNPIDTGNINNLKPTVFDNPTPTVRNPTIVTPTTTVVNPAPSQAAQATTTVVAGNAPGVENIKTVVSTVAPKVSADTVTVPEIVAPRSIQSNVAAPTAPIDMSTAYVPIPTPAPTPNVQNTQPAPMPVQSAPVTARTDVSPTPATTVTPQASPQPMNVTVVAPVSPPAASVSPSPVSPPTQTPVNENAVQTNTGYNVNPDMPSSTINVANATFGNAQNITAGKVNTKEAVFNGATTANVTGNSVLNTPQVNQDNQSTEQKNIKPWSLNTGEVKNNTSDPNIVAALDKIAGQMAATKSSIDSTNEMARKQFEVNTFNRKVDMNNQQAMMNALKPDTSNNYGSSKPVANGNGQESSRRPTRLDILQGRGNGGNNVTDTPVSKTPYKPPSNPTPPDSSQNKPYTPIS